MPTEHVLVEFRPAGRLREARRDPDKRVLHDVVLITANSVNGEHGKRTYTAKALQQIAEKSEGLPAYANHVPKDQAWKPRDVKDLIGRHQHVRYDTNRKRVLSDLHVLEYQAGWVFALAEDLPDVVGASLVSRGLVRVEGDKEIVEEIVAVRSGDLVSDPGATRGLFEHRENWERGTHGCNRNIRRGDTREETAMGVFRVISGSDTNTIEAQRERLRFALMGAEYPSPEAMAKDAAAYQASEREREAALRESRIPPAITDEARERLAVACGLPPTASESGRERLRAALQGSRYVPPQYRPAPMEERTSQNLHESIRRKANEVRR